MSEANTPSFVLHCPQNRLPRRSAPRNDSWGVIAKALVPKPKPQNHHPKTLYKNPASQSTVIKQHFLANWFKANAKFPHTLQQLKIRGY